MARDEFWQLLIELSRKQSVTIFISTHFMNEAARCDRISLMNARKVLAQGTPQELVRSRHANGLEQAFISYLEEATGAETRTGEAGEKESALPRSTQSEQITNNWFSVTRLWAYARRETAEILRDRVRLAFALLAPALLLLILGYGISLDVEHVSYAALDQDNSPESRTYLENFRGSRYFDQHRPFHDQQDEERRLQQSEMRMAIEIPPRFGRDLKSGRVPEIAAWVDASNSFYGDSIRDYVIAVNQLYLDDFRTDDLRQQPQKDPADIEARLRYNQDFKSIALLPGDIMLLLIYIPAMLTALGVVREKELGSITNFYGTPTTRLEFLWGKQAPYVAIALVQFATLLALAVWLFGVPVKGSMIALLVGAALYVTAATSFGLLLSTFLRTQIAAILAAEIITNLPASQFSGWLTPISSLGRFGCLFGHAFPSAFFQYISLGAFTKARDLPSLLPDLAALVCFIAVYLAVSIALLDKQEL